MCPPIWAYWRQLANMIEFMLPLAHQSPQPKRKTNKFRHSYTVHGRKSLYIMTGPFPKIAPFHGGLEPHLIHDSLGHSKITIEMA